MSQKTVEMLLKEMGQKEVYSITVGATVRKLSHDLTLYNVGALVVLEGGKIVGIVSERDIVRKVVHKGLSDLTLVKTIMSKEIVSVTSFTNLAECERLMEKEGIRHLPVIDKEKLTAVISIRDLLVSTRLEQEQLVGHLIGYFMPGNSV